MDFKNQTNERLLVEIKKINIPVAYTAEYNFFQFKKKLMEFWKTFQYRKVLRYTCRVLIKLSFIGSQLTTRPFPC